VKAIAAFGTSESLEKLVMIFATTVNRDDRLLLLDVVAKHLTAEFVHPFGIMVRDIAKPGKVDISGWTNVAITTLKDICKRQSIDVHIEKESQPTNVVSEGIVASVEYNH
jgi:uncharacterized protein YwbE